MLKYHSHPKEHILDHTDRMLSHIHNQDLKTAVCGTVLYLLFLSGGVQGQSDPPASGGNNTTSSALLVTTDPAGCPATDPAGCPATSKCNTAAAVIGSLVAGLVLGVVFTYCVQLVLRRRKQRIPPKDYVVPDTRQYDVNRNSDGSIHVTSDQSRVKGHKKLERLVKLSHTSPGSMETTPAAAPLIHIVSSTVEPGPSTTNPSTSTSMSSPATGQEVTYANIGAVSNLTQGYDILEIIPEESEYENSRSSAYEGILVEPATK